MTESTNYKKLYELTRNVSSDNYKTLIQCIRHIARLERVLKRHRVPVPPRVGRVKALAEGKSP